MGNEMKQNETKEAEWNETKRNGMECNKKCLFLLRQGSDLVLSLTYAQVGAVQSN